MCSVCWKESGENNNRRLAVKTNGSLCFVDTGMIRYIQALERESILYLVNEHRQVQASIKELEAELPLILPVAQELLYQLRLCMAKN